ncbi:MAG: RES family NAD+ phosphorylase [Gammaproteobacteria bacterium]|nr:RES family NAD+ phosphorylase [Gammaproteobacteria bacterium]MCF6230940.1 RES family NAD+ phosphorylase [Gammaproteobacteria bacterium]
MKIYRIAPTLYLDNYQGLGASYRDGARWNRPGQPALYFALSAATALLEMANYLPSPRTIPASYHLGIYDISDSSIFLTLPEEELPTDWATFPHPPSTQAIGGNWLSSGNEMGLLVPSSAVPEGLENIILINPQHCDSSTIQLIKSTKELFNKRTFTGIVPPT